MTVLVTVDLSIKPDRVAEILELLTGALPDTRAYAGCEVVDTFVDQDDPGHILLVGRWAERTDHETYLGWRTEQGLFDTLADAVTAPPRFTYLDPRPDV